MPQIVEISRVTTPLTLKKRPVPLGTNKLTTKSKIFEREDHPGTAFRRFYERGDLPLSIVHSNKSSISWKIPIDKLNLQHYLPLFVDGVRERNQPYLFLATEGSTALVRSTTNTDRLLSMVPQLILPLKHGLETRDTTTMLRVMDLLTEIIKACPAVGEALVPYYRQLLPVLNKFIHSKQLATEIEELLALLELTGGEDAFVNIKYICPTYESHAQPSATEQPLLNQPQRTQHQQ
jgi:hypothetical protein